MAGVGGTGTTILNQIEMATVPSQQGLNQNLLSKNDSPQEVFLALRELRNKW